jgi:small subunit ribosomal protein S7
MNLQQTTRYQYVIKSLGYLDCLFCRNYSKKSNPPYATKKDQLVFEKNAVVLEKKKNAYKKPLSNRYQANFDRDLFFKKLTNLLMYHGKKMKASKIVVDMLKSLKNSIQKNFNKKNSLYIPVSPLEKKSSLNRISLQTGESPLVSWMEQNDTSQVLHVITKALENVTPNLETRKVRVAGSTYIVPAVLSKKKQQTLALKWIIESAKKRQKSSPLRFSQCLADEILDAFQKVGQARQRRDELHHLALMNRAYVRYRWW